MRDTPTYLEEYRIIRLIGRGGMGDVYLAHDTLLDRPVAIKFIRMAKENAHAREQFFFEARSAARVQHPNVCVVYRVGQWQGRPYIVSELIKGISLAQIAVPLPEREAIEIGLGLARGLAAAHRQGLLHRDVKPANVLRAETGEIKLVDFGIAELAPEADDVTTGEVPAPIKLPVGSANSRRESYSDALVRDTAPTRLPTPRIRGRSSSHLRLDTMSILGLGTKRIIGTPDYIAPELWLGQRATRQSDVYALGAVLYELCIGVAPYHSSSIDELPSITQVEDRSLALADPSINSGFAEVVDRCLCRDISQRFASAEEVRDALEGLSPRAAVRSIPEGNPYRGLRSFEAEHVSLFFGRNREMRAIVERMRAESFVVVAGDSGVGKSSICKAGVVPYILIGAFGEERTWETVSLVPGRRPLAALMNALSALLGGYRSPDTSPEGAVGGMGWPHSFSLASTLSKALGKSKGLVVFVDQLEELATISEASEVVPFCQRLDEILLSSLPVRVLATARGDFFPRLATLPGMGERLGRALHVLQPLDAEGIREAIIGPAEAKGVRYESDALVKELVRSTEDTEEGLPLLQFALAELWETRDASRKIISQSALSSIGGVAGALARYADTVLAQMLPSAQESARRILLALVTSEATRARRTLNELGGDDIQTRFALEKLVQARLLVVREAEGGSVYEVAHEALLTGWSTLRHWMDESVHLRAVQERLTTAATEWERLGRSNEALWGQRQLEEVAKLELGNLRPSEGEFLHASHLLIQRKRRSRRTLVCGIPILLGLIVSVFVFRERKLVAERIGKQVIEAKEILQKAEAENARLERDRKEAMAIFSSDNRDDAEPLWKTVQTRSRDLGQRYRDVTQKLEAALFMDIRNDEVRGLLADVLYKRALMAERNGHTAEQDELIKRLRFFDKEGERWASWNASGQVFVRTEPEGASILIEEYRKDPSGNRVATALEGPISTAAEAPLQLHPGSYRLIVSLPGRVTVKYPFIVNRGERATLRIRLPTSEEVPPGFVYIPAGVSLVGTNTDDDLRRWFGSIPMRSVRNKGYFIRRTETTVREWIEYLDSLPEKERRLRTPNGGTFARRGEVRLEQSEGKWSYSLVRGVNHFISDSNGFIEFGGRDRRRKQRWRELPVSSISYLDAVAFAKFRSERRSPLGARLCSEEEWERGARGADDRVFPHGDQISGDDANFDKTYDQNPAAMGPDEVGSHPRSRSPFDLDDMAGNVLEWTLGTEGFGVSRGGSYYDAAITNTIVNRETPELSFRDSQTGFRLCADVPWE